MRLQVMHEVTTVIQIERADNARRRVNRSHSDQRQRRKAGQARWRDDGR